MMEPIGGKKLAIEDETKQGGREGGEKITAIRSATFEVITKHERVVFMQDGYRGKACLVASGR